MADSGLYKKLYGGAPMRQQSTAPAPEPAGSQGSGDPYKQAGDAIRKSIDPDVAKKRLGNVFK